MLRKVEPLYVSASGKGLVARAGTTQNIGATVAAEGVRPSGRDGPGRITYDLEEVFEIPAEEVRLHGRTYAKELAPGGGLVRRSKADHAAWLLTRDKRDQKAVDDQAAKDQAALDAKVKARGEQQEEAAHPKDHADFLADRGTAARDQASEQTRDAGKKDKR